MSCTIPTTLAGQDATVTFPNGRPTGRLVIFVHGGGLDYSFATVMPSQGSQAYTRVQELIEHLALNGFVIVCAALQDTSLVSKGDHFGNDASTTQLANVITAVQGLSGVSSGKYGLIGFSSACMTIANHVRRVGSSNIAGILSLCPAFNISFYRGRDASQGGAYANANLAHGIGGVAGTTACDSAWDAIAAVKEPAIIAPSVTVPWAFWSSSNDPAAPPSQSATAPAAQVGLTAASVAASVASGKGSWRNMGSADTNVNIGHNTTLVEPSAVLAFMATWVW